MVVVAKLMVSVFTLHPEITQKLTRRCAEPVNGFGWPSEHNFTEIFERVMLCFPQIALRSVSTTFLCAPAGVLMPLPIISVAEFEKHEFSLSAESFPEGLPTHSPTSFTNPCQILEYN